ncbi:class A beta-lactamase [uncultured Sphingomonas sp.]|uniref:class A beta-lactamase n=1 Tax=uncultured Sphingomonas sp. TaxID=158754 RepID=UPI0035C98D04
MLSRRRFVAGGAAALLPAAAMSRAASFIAGVAALERTLGAGARIGVWLVDPPQRLAAGRRADERFPMCSTFKLLLAGQVLYRVDRGLESLDRMVTIPRAAIIANSPVSSDHAEGALPVRTLCEAMVTQSDNAAANLLLATLGGPAGLTRHQRSIGDRLTRLDRIETDLNEAVPGDPRDTSTPAQMVANLHGLAAGNVLRPASRQILIDWLTANRTGGERLKKGLPAGWSIGDKTGAGDHGSNNEVALLWPPGRERTHPAFLACYITGGRGEPLARNPVHAAIGALAAAAITGA